jgi:hypothetical protein
MLRDIRIIVSISLVVAILSFFIFGALEPGLATAQTASDTVVITLNVTQQISITSPADSSMSTALSLSQNTAVGTTTWNVKTNDALGYTMALKATTTPAMTATSSGVLYTIDDYQRGAPTLWSVSNTAKFGYSAFGNDSDTSVWGTGGACGASANGISTTLKYQGLATSTAAYTVAENVASRTATTSASGTDTNVCYAVEQNNFFIAAATYNATVIATATGN